MLAPFVVAGLRAAPAGGALLLSRSALPASTSRPASYLRTRVTFAGVSRVTAAWKCKDFSDANAGSVSYGSGDRLRRGCSASKEYWESSTCQLVDHR